MSERHLPFTSLTPTAYLQLLVSCRFCILLLLLISLGMANDFYQRLWVHTSSTEKHVPDQVPVLTAASLPLPLDELAQMWPNAIQASIEKTSPADVGPDHALFSDENGSYRLVAVFANTKQQMLNSQTDPARLWLARIKFTPAATQASVESKELLLMPGQQFGRFTVESISINHLQLKMGEEIISLYLFKPTSRNEASQ